jgi:predicted dehydrogenase/threonine dehydrogenase-like Zn-dependent dehydrogenase
MPIVAPILIASEARASKQNFFSGATSRIAIRIDNDYSLASMKQLIQSASTGELALLDVPTPSTPAGGILVRVKSTLVSAGTERSMVTFGEKSLLQKARSRPDLVRQTIEKAKRDGVLDTIDAVRNRLEQPMNLGYSAAGTVIEAGPGADEFRPGDRVACAGAGIAVHAQMIAVPRNLAIHLPESVSFEAGAFTTVGSIALHGIRLAGLQLGEVAVVIGLGLLGQLTVQMLRASGCTVLGIDPMTNRALLATKMGASWAGSDPAELTARALSLTSGRGADAVLITADTKQDQPVELAGEVARSRGSVISVGTVGMNLPRRSYFEKELAFRVSRSYGPGRYDDSYERQGRDYPYDYVRWTENRNMIAFAHLVETGAVQIEPLISHRFDIEDGLAAYDVVLGRTDETSLGVVLQYSEEPEQRPTIRLEDSASHAQVAESVRVGVLGAGLFANGTLLPAMHKTAGIELRSIASAGGLSARAAGQRFGFAECATSESAILADPAINTIAVLTRHDLHARQTISALRAGKHVFVEKPLCLTNEELDDIIAAYRPAESMLMVGFNRRFAPFVVELRDALRKIAEPLFLTARVNAGFIPPQHWVHDSQLGGGRLRGEGCHFIDLLIDLARDRVRRVRTVAIPDSGRYRGDNFQITLEFSSGSIGVVSYVANGSRAAGKERLEVFGGGLSAQLDDYRSLEIHAPSKSTRRTARLRQDKGHRAEWQAVARHLLNGGPPPIPFAELVHSTRVTLAAFESLQTGEAIDIASGETLNPGDGA